MLITPQHSVGRGHSADRSRRRPPAARRRRVSWPASISFDAREMPAASHLRHRRTTAGISRPPEFEAEMKVANTMRSVSRRATSIRLFTALADIGRLYRHIFRYRAYLLRRQGTYRTTFIVESRRCAHAQVNTPWQRHDKSMTRDYSRRCCFR